MVIDALGPERGTAVNDNSAIESTATRSIALLRLGIGLVQGLAAWALLRLVPWTTAYDSNGKPVATHTWAQAHPMLFAAMALVTAYVPLLALAEAGRMRARALAIYLAVAVAGLSGLVVYDLWRDPSGDEVRIWPSSGLMAGAALGLFIVNQLLEHRERRHPLFTHYAAHFEDSWMRGFQLVLSLGFTGLFWGVLELGRGLFDLIHLTGFGHMIEHNWFRCPALAMAFAASVHITDVRPALLRGMRNLGLTLLSWLLPLEVALGCAFLGALLFTGLAPLWSTRFAASILLGAVWQTLVLLNAAYNDGTPEHRPMLPLRWAGRAAGPMMLILALLAAYAIGLRVGQHGWTPQRVRSVAVAVMALIYGGGYTWAAFARGDWMKRLERVNVVASLVILALLAALFTPLADPARLAVNSQVARLHAGSVAPDKFDYQFLRFDAGRYGSDALALLMHDANPQIASRARVAKGSTARSYGREDKPDPAVTEAPLSHATVYPKGAKLPDDFNPAHFDKDVGFMAQCLRDGSPCDVFLWPGTAQRSHLLIVRETQPEGNVRNANRVANIVLSPMASLPVLGRDSAGHWGVVGRINHVDCPAALAALRGGDAQPARPAHDDLIAGGVRLEFQPDAGPDPCAVSPPKPVTPTPPDASAPPGMGPAFGKPGGI